MKSAAEPRRLTVALLAAGLGLGSCQQARPRQPTAHAGPAAATATQPAARSSSPPPPGRTMPAGHNDPPRVALGTHGAVSSQDRLATEVGLAILKRGGNAVDAAIAVAFALAATHPAAGNVGGGGFMVVHLASGRDEAIDFRETAPSAATRDMYLDASGKPTKDSVRGPKAAGIPGTVAGMELAHREFGALPWSALVAPAVALAAGHPLDADEADDLSDGAKAMRKAGYPASAGYYERPSGGAFAAGDAWRDPELSATLAAIAADPRAFYEGPLADKLVLGVRKAGGIWQREDLAGYRAVVRAPQRFSYRGHQLVTMPLPSAGGIVLAQILRGAELLDLARYPWHSPDEEHLYLEISRRAYADRALLGDPAFVSVPVAELTSDAYLEKRIADIDSERATPSKDVAPGILPRQVVAEPRHESPQTTHFSVIDGQGDAVSATVTLNDSFGSKFVVPGAGVLLNDEMDDFSAKPGAPNMYGLVQGEQNAIAPGKRMLSSMTPTIVLKDGRVRAVLGTPGGPTITTTVAQIARALIDYAEPLDAAVAAPRLHHQWLPDAVIAERRAPPALLDALDRRGYRFVLRDQFGSANCIEVDPPTGGFRAVADTTRGGAAAAAY